MTRKDTGHTRIRIGDLEAYVQRYGWVADRLDDTALRTALVAGNLQLPLAAQIDDPFVYLRLFLFPGAVLDDGTDYRRLLQLNDEAAMVKLSIERDNHLVASIDVLQVTMDYAVFETAIDLLYDFLDSFYEDLAAAVRLADDAGSDQ